MSDSWTDPGSLEGDALTRWSLRSPAEIDQERQAAAARRYQEFFSGPPSADPDPGFHREAPSPDQDVDPGFAVSLPAKSQDVDPGFTWVPAGPNRWRSVKIEDLQSPSSTALMSYNGTAPADGGIGGLAHDHDDTAPTASLDLTPQPVTQATGELRGPPALTYGAMTTAGRSGPRMRASDPLAQPRPTPTRAPASSVGPAKASHPSAGQTIAYGTLRAPAPSDQGLAELRRQQAAFANTTRKIDLQNSWFAAPALAAPLAVMGLEGAAAWAARSALPEVEQAPLQFVERDPYLRVGDNWATRAGRRAHAWLEERLASKPGWDYEPDVPRPGAKPLKPDVGTPQRNPADLDKRYYLELKPNTPTGRAAAVRAAKRYFDATRQKVRPIYYDPKDFM